MAAPAYDDGETPLSAEALARTPLHPLCIEIFGQAPTMGSKSSREAGIQISSLVTA
jgi:hypothetical protein